MTAIIIPWRRVLPAQRSQLHSAGIGRAQRPEYRLAPVNRPDLPPHYHVEHTAGRDPCYQLARPAAGMQVLASSVPKGILPCEAIDCPWYLSGKEGMDEGAPFSHPTGVECGDERGCLDDNCPCPQRVVEWPDGVARGHIVPCVYCAGTYRQAAAGSARTVTFDEYFYRLDEGLDTLVTLTTRGV